MAKKSSRTTMRKRAPRRSKTAPTREKPTPLWAIILAAALFFGLLFMIGYELTRDRAPPGAQDRVLASVNGEEITASRLEFHYQLLPPAYRAQLSREQVLEELISEALLLQAAKGEGISASQEEVHERVQQVLADGKLSPAEFEQRLAESNVTVEQFEGLVARQIVLEAYRAKHLPQAPKPTDADIEQRYNDTVAQYALPERVTARHILIRSERDDAAPLAKRVYDDVLAGADFCAYVTNTTDDRASVGTCGEYTFPRGMMVPEFEQAAFGMADGETRLIQTQFGYHVLQRIKMVPAGTQSLAEVRDKIKASLESEIQQRMYRDLVKELREKATVVYANETADAIVPAAPVAVAMPQQPTQAPAAPQQPAESQDAPTVMAPAGPAQPEAAQSPAALQPTGAAGVLACVARVSTLYGTSWSTDTRSARDLFARENVALTYVACDEKDACDGVVAYPTWDIAGTRYLGRLTLEQLRRAAGC